MAAWDAVGGTPWWGEGSVGGMGAQPEGWGSDVEGGEKSAGGCGVGSGGGLHGVVVAGPSAGCGVAGLFASDGGAGGGPGGAVSVHCVRWDGVCWMVVVGVV